MFRRQSRAQSATASMERSRNVTLIKARSKSFPTYPNRQNVKGILKYATVDDSLHNPYRNGRIDENNNNDKGIQFKDIHIREYARTLSDNPSCTAGPPIG